MPQVVTRLRPRSTVSLVDELGALRASIAMLVEKEEAVRAQIVAQGDGRYTGKLFEATVVTQERGYLDLDAARAKLSAQFLAKHTRYQDVTYVHCKARSIR